MTKRVRIFLILAVVFFSAVSFWYQPSSQWSKENVLMVVVQTDSFFASPMYYYEFIDARSVKTISFTSSSHRYHWSDGEIIIPE